MPSITPTPDNLTPVLHEVFRQVCAALPPELSGRLKPGRRVTRHGTRNTVLLSGIWDRHLKSGVVDPRYFKYEHVYDPDHAYGEGADWHVQFYLNPNRIYQHPDEVLAKLEPALASVTLPGFEFLRKPNWIGVIHRFDLAYEPDALVRYLVPRYVALIRAIHPVLIAILDAFDGSLGPEDRARVIAGREPLRARNAAGGEGASVFSRAIASSLRARVLVAYGHRCARCGTMEAAAGSPLEIDHALPVRDGGLTKPDNLQPLCRPCHQWKGLRTIRFPPPSH
ncbi:MAG: HNH endonuclease [Verrucomicrobiae bacterium]|nr:HNH endonuclease [Verrucomicrobiae bacterium]